MAPLLRSAAAANPFPIVFLLLLLLLLLRSCFATHFSYIGFDHLDPPAIHCFLGASLSDNSLLLTAPNAIQNMGRCLYGSPVRFLDDSGLPISFSTQFIFQIFPGPEGLADGISFVIAPSLVGVNGSSQGFLGIFNNDTNGQSSAHTLAIEFDTYKNPEFLDMDDNHVGIDVNSIVSWFSVSAAFRTSNSPVIRNADDGYAVQMKGSPIQAWISYDATTNLLNISVSRSLGRMPQYPLISNSSLNLTSVLNQDMFVGFTASTGPLDDILYYVYAWSFSNEGDAAAVSMPSSGSVKPNVTAIAVGVTFGLLAMVVVASIAAFLFLKKKRSYWSRCGDEKDKLELALDENSPRQFSYRELSRATNRFSAKNHLGTGGFGSVYRGKLPSTMSEIAVKRISKESKQGVKEFVSEVRTIGQLRHRNLVPLLGWCQEKGFMLVYELMPNGSLDKFLFEKQGVCLTWPMRLHILKGVAAAVNYLHEECEQKIIHRDIKASNVMLDAHLNARLGDFGLARPYGHDVAPDTTNVAGTWGYIAPEAFYTRKATDKTDVFSFGVLTLEVVTGRKVSDYIETGECGLIDWLWLLHRKKTLLEAADQTLQLDNEEDRSMVISTLELGLCCCFAQPKSRPSMRHVIQVLCGDAPPLSMPPVISSPFYVSSGSSSSYQFSTSYSNASSDFFSHVS